jgi:hypothetical protein
MRRLCLNSNCLNSNGSLGKRFSKLQGTLYLRLSISDICGMGRRRTGGFFSSYFYIQRNFVGRKRDTELGPNSARTTPEAQQGDP